MPVCRHPREQRAKQEREERVRVECERDTPLSREASAHLRRKSLASTERKRNYRKLGTEPCGPSTGGGKTWRGRVGGWMVGWVADVHTPGVGDLWHPGGREVDRPLARRKKDRAAGSVQRLLHSAIPVDGVGRSQANGDAKVSALGRRSYQCPATPPCGREGRRTAKSPSTAHVVKSSTYPTSGGPITDCWPQLSYLRRSTPHDAKVSASSCSWPQDPGFWPHVLGELLE